MGPNADGTKLAALQLFALVIWSYCQKYLQRNMVLETHASPETAGCNLSLLRLVLCCAVLCCAVLCRAVPCCAVLRLRCALLRCAVLCCKQRQLRQGMHNAMLLGAEKF